MRTALTLLLATPLMIVGAPDASAVDCITSNEFQMVDMGDSKAHTEFDLFDDYHGALVDAWSADGWNWRLKAYVYCGDGAATIVYKRDAGTDDAFRVHSKTA